MDTEKMDKIRNQNRIRQARYRQQPKMHKLDQNQGEENQTSGKRLTIAQHEKQKETWRKQEQKQRANMSAPPPQKRRIREKDRSRKKKENRNDTRHKAQNAQV